MKNFIQSIFIAAALVAGLSISSCTKDPCSGVVCSNGGTCASGTCTCAAGYEGSDCQTLWNAKFVYSSPYNVTETCSRDSCGTALPLPSGPYTSTIAAGANPTDITIANFGNYGAGVVVHATLTDATHFTVVSTTIGGATFTGTGSISNTTITMNYKATSGCDVGTCAATYTR